MNTDSQKRIRSFSDLDLSEDLIEVLTRLKFVTPTPIQAKAIPVALKGNDVIGIAQTGTGKTLAFFLPMLESIEQNRGMGLIVVPTRELAYQVKEEIDRVGGRLGFRTALLIGGAAMHHQMKSLKRHPHIIVATPGRLIDHIERRSVKLDQVKTLVLDEADRMLDMGFAPQIDQILQSVPDKRQTMLFSATMPEGVAKIANGYMRSPIRIEVAPQGTSAKNIEQGIFYVTKQNKFNLLMDMLNEYKDGPVLVFCRTKHGTKKMARVLKDEGFHTEELHSNRTLSQRRRALENFKKGRSRVLIATDVASRGIDVKEIELVINYDLPDQSEDYVHRIGRTGRAGHKGHAVSFAEPNQKRDVYAIEKILDKKIPVLEAPGTISAEEVERMGSRYSRPSGGGRGRGRGRGGRPQGRGGFGGQRRSSGGGGRGRSSGARSGGAGGYAKSGSRSRSRARV